MSVTLEDIENTQSKLEKMIAEFKEQKQSIVHIQQKEIQLASGERYAGMILGKEGELSYHLILMDGQVEDVNWEKAKEWAWNLGGELPSSLPTRREQALLFANLKEEFEEAAYWSSEEHASYSSYAWYQYFRNGYQNSSSKSFSTIRARAVRRLAI